MLSSGWDVRPWTVHFQIVANIALRLLRLLVERGIQPNVVSDHNLTVEDAEVIVVLSALLHDLGMSVHRIDHEQYSLFIAMPKIKELLLDLYEVAPRTILTSEILHAIISTGGRAPLNTGSGYRATCRRTGHGRGRTRIPFQAGQVNIHRVCGCHREGPNRAWAGETDQDFGEDEQFGRIFQVDELLRNKLKGSGLEPIVRWRQPSRAKQRKT